MESNPHDRFARRAFADLDVMRAHLHAFLPPGVVERLDLAGLAREPDTHLDPDLRERLSDLLFSAPTRDGGRALVWFVFEHKSTPDRFLPYDLLRSITRILESWRRDHSDARDLPWVVPLVLYAGTRRFDAPRRLTELNGDPASVVSPSLGPDLGYVLTDLSRFGDEDLRRRTGDVAFAALAHLLLKHARADDLFDRLGRWADLLRALLAAPTGLDGLRTVLSYLFAARGADAEQQIAAVVLPRLDEHDRETVMTTFKSYADILREEGQAKGELRGEMRGRQRGAAEMLLRVLRRRFVVSETLAARIGSAPLVDLDRWCDRALDADRLDDVFGD